MQRNREQGNIHLRAVRSLLIQSNFNPSHSQLKQCTADFNQWCVGSKNLFVLLKRLPHGFSYTNPHKYCLLDCVFNPGLEMEFFTDSALSTLMPSSKIQDLEAINRSSLRKFSSTTFF